MKEILETIIKNLVVDKDAVSINEVEGEKSVIYEVKVAESDMGKVIGKDGKIIYDPTYRDTLGFNSFRNKKRNL